MNHLHLLDRIKELDVNTIEKMSPETMNRVTSGFDESLVRNIIYTGTTNFEQRKIIKAVKNKYRNWNQSNNFLWIETYPEFIEDLQMDIECGLVVTANGNFPESEAKLKISTIPSGAKPVRPISKATQQANNTKNDGMTENQKQDTSMYENRIKELEEENKRLKEQVEDFEELAKSTSKNISWHDKVRLELALRFMEKADCNLSKYGNKARAARILQAITKLPISTCKNYVTNRDLNTQEHKEELLEINTELQTLGTEILL